MPAHMNKVNKLNPIMKKIRKRQYPVHPLFLNRWSPRAMSGENLSKKELMGLFEAARWAPSSYNGQLWKFLYVLKESKEWKLFFDLMVEFNQSWTKNASALVVIISKKTFDHNGKPANTHSFDAGAAWENLALQATINGLIAHGMSGFDYEKAKKDLKIPDDHQVEAMIAIGKPGKKSSLQEEMQKQEIPSGRKNISEIVTEGTFNF